MERELAKVFSLTQIEISMKVIFVTARCMAKAFISMQVVKNIAVIGLMVIKLVRVFLVIPMEANIWAIF